MTDADSVGHGVRAGLSRCLLGIPGFDPAGVDESGTSSFVADVVLGSLQEAGKVWSPAALEFVSEAIAVGVFARAHFGELPLAREDVAAFLPSFESTVNRFTSI